MENTWDIMRFPWKKDHRRWTHIQTAISRCSSLTFASARSSSNFSTKSKQPVSYATTKGAILGLQRFAKALPVVKKKYMWSVPYTQSAWLSSKHLGRMKRPCFCHRRFHRQRSGRVRSQSRNNQVMSHVVNWFLLCAFYVGSKPSTNDKCIDYK